MDQELQMVKNVLKSLLIVVPHGMTVAQLEKDFWEMEGRAIPFRRFSFNSLLEFLNSIPDTLFVTWRSHICYVYPAMSEGSFHIRQMVVEQRNVRRKPRSAKRPPPRPQYRPSNSNYNQRFEPASVSWQHTAARTNATNTAPAIVPRREWKNETTQRTNAHQLTPPPSVTSSRPATRAKLLALADSIAKLTKSMVSQAKDDRKPHANTHCSYEQAAVPSQSKSIHLEVKGNTAIKSQPSSVVSESSSSTSSPISSSSSSISSSPISSSSSSISSSSRSSSEKSSKNRVNTQSYRLFSERIEEETDALPNMTQLEFLTILGNDDFIITEDPFENVCIEQYGSIDVGSTMKILISDVHSPYKFWFQLHSSSDELESLMDALRFYDDNSEDEMYFLPEHLRKIGQICVALYENQWHRARIVDVYEDGTVKVFYLDHGWIDEIFFDEVRLLRTEMAKLLPQAIRGCLDNVRPAMGLWTRWATMTFRKAVSQVKIYAKVTGVDSKEKTFYMNAIDTTKETDVNINEVLVDYGHAVHEDVPLVKWKARHYNERYPTFDMLENGAYPSFSEIGHYEEMGFDFANYEESIINETMNGYSAEI